MYSKKINPLTRYMCGTAHHNIISHSIPRHKTRSSSVTPRMKYISTIKHHYLNLWTHYLLLSTKTSSRYKKIDLLICEWNWFINLPLYIYFTLFENFVGLVVCSCINKKRTSRFIPLILHNTVIFFTHFDGKG